jgi:ATP-dependent DNA helicase RecG
MRISAGTSMDPGDILDRLGLRREGVVTQAAQMLYGTRFLPDYPQGRLKLGRFRGTKITGDILDNRQDYLHAFAAVREGMAFLERTLPLSGHFVEGRIEREDRLALPPDALREVLLNAVMHRDYAQPGGHVAIAVFDDRVEIRSTGALPAGITAEQLSGPHPSVLRNPLIAETFHRTGAVEVWGRGTNRVIDECRRYGVDEPTFEEQGGTVVVTFRAAIALGPEMTPQVTPHVTPQVTPQVLAVLGEARKAGSRNELMEAAGLRDREHFRSAYLEPLLDAGWLEMTIPDKPRSPKQRYRTTEAGKRVLAEAEREE